MIKIKFEKDIDTRKCYSTGSILGQNGKIKNEVFDNSIVHTIIKDIDGGDVVDRNIIRLPKYDLLIPTMSLAGGIQALLYLLSSPEYPIRLSAFGPNCYKYIWDISKIVDYDILLSSNGREISLVGRKRNDDDYCICLNDNSMIFDDGTFYELAWRYVKHDWG